MKSSYHDIVDIAGTPRWHDENGTPRYAPHKPDLCPDIYKEEVVLMLIACQACGAEFKVQLSSSTFSRVYRAEDGTAGLYPSLEDEIKERAIHYGDPPFTHPCCVVGPTMNSVPQKILEYWKKDKGTWLRVPELEIEVTPDWAN